MNNEALSYKEYSLGFGSEQDAVTNVMQLENKLLNTLLDYGKFLEQVNDSCCYLGVGISSFEEFLSKRPLYPDICYLAHSLFCHVKQLKESNKNAKSINPDQCPDCGFVGLIHQGGCLYCPMCGYSRCG